MNSFDIFFSLLNPMLVINSDGVVMESNDAISTMTGLTRRQAKSKIFPDFLGLEQISPLKISTIQDVTAYKETGFKTDHKTGTLSYSIQPFGAGAWLVAIYDLTLEASLHSKYRHQRASNENLSSEILTQKAELLLSRDELERKVSQMSFLLSFYAETRFVLEPSLIAEVFLKIACEKLGFMSGVYFYSVPGKQSLKVGPTFSLDPESTPLNSSEIVLEPAAKSRVGVTVYTQDEIKSCPIYTGLGITTPLNSVVVSLTKESRIFGQFHIINYIHNADPDENTLELLGYMLAPLTLTFENAELYRSSVTDELSQLNNVRYFRMRLASEIKRAERDRKNLCLLLLDIDHFKKVNDTYGHPTGDQVIFTVASCLKESVRSTDIVARYGGEEMVIIFPGASTEDALRIAEEIRKKIAALVFKSSTGEFSITISGGISSYPATSQEQEELIQKADQALYLSKSNGRNRNTLA